MLFGFNDLDQSGNKGVHIPQIKSTYGWIRVCSSLIKYFDETEYANHAQSCIFVIIRMGVS